MKIPREITGKQLAEHVKKFGYTITRQKGGHIRLTTNVNGEHHITIPAHRNLKIGTLNSILSDIAAHLEMSKSDLIKKLF